MRFDRLTGSLIQHDHYLFEAFPGAEVFRETAGSAVLGRIEAGMRSFLSRHDPARMLVQRTTVDGQHRSGYLDASLLLPDLISLLQTSTTLTLIVAGSRAERSLQAAMATTGRLKVDENETHVSQLGDTTS